MVRFHFSVGSLQRFGKVGSPPILLVIVLKDVWIICALAVTIIGYFQ